MAARLWQTCVRRLPTPSELSNYNVSKLLNEWSSWSSGGIFPRSYVESAGRTRAAGGELWIHTDAGVGPQTSPGRTLVGEESLRVKISGGRILSPFTRWGSAMQSSTIPSNEQDRPSDIVSSGSDVERSEDAEFVPENLCTLRTPLVRAIRYAEDDAVSKVVSPGPRASPGEIPLSQREIDPSRVFVGGLPFASRGDEMKEALREFFGKYANVKDVELAQHRNQSKKSTVEGKHRGFAFVTLGSPEEAETAIEKLNGESLLGRTITVSYGLKRLELDPPSRQHNAERIARCKVFVGSLHQDTTLETLENRFNQYGTVVRAKLIYELATGKSRGFGFITFSTEAEAMKAILDLDGSILDGSVIRVNIAKYPQSV